MGMLNALNFDWCRHHELWHPFARSVSNGIAFVLEAGNLKQTQKQSIIREI
jgi:hypothetical protein